MKLAESASENQKSMDGYRFSFLGVLGLICLPSELHGVTRQSTKFVSLMHVPGF